MPKSTAAQLADIRARVEERHRENLRRLDAIDSRQQSMDTKLDSLLQTRSFTRGVMRAAMGAGGVASVLVTIVIAVVNYFRGH